MGAPRRDIQAPHESDLPSLGPAQRRLSPWCRDPTKCRLALLVAAALVLCVAGGVIVSAYRRDILSGAIADWMEDKAPLSAFCYGGFMVLWVVLCLPATLLEIAGGFIFDRGTALITLIIAKESACCLAFLLGRYLIGAEALQRMMDNRGTGKRRWRAFCLGMKKHPWKVTALVRLLYIPLGLKNYGLSMLPCPFYCYAICTFLASGPYTLLWVHVGASSRSLLDVWRYRGLKGLRWPEISALSFGLVLLITLLAVIQHFTAKYAARLEEEELLEGSGTAIVSKSYGSDTVDTIAPESSELCCNPDAESSVRPQHTIMYM